MSDWKTLYHELKYNIEDALSYRTEHGAFVRIGKALAQAEEKADKLDLPITKEPELLNEVYHRPLQNRNDEHMRDWEPLRGSQHWSEEPQLGATNVEP